MDFIPAAFRFERRTMLPILKVTGTVTPVPGIALEKILLSEAVKIIEKAEEFNGKTMELNEDEDMNDISEDLVTVRFSIIFKNEDDFQKAISSIKGGWG